MDYSKINKATLIDMINDYPGEKVTRRQHKAVLIVILEMRQEEEAMKKVDMEPMVTPIDMSSGTTLGLYFGIAGWMIFLFYGIYSFAV